MRSRVLVASASCAVLAATFVRVLSAAAPSESCNTEILQAMAPAETTVAFATRESGGVCRVHGYVTTRDPGLNKVMFVLGLPDNFNDRYLYMGVGGAAGLLPSLRPELLSRGYVLAGSDGGTGATSMADFSFMKDSAKALDFTSRGVHVSASATQQITKKYYKRNAMRRFISGCSGGGQMGLGNALRFGSEDFDGFIVGATVWPGDPYMPNVYGIAQLLQKNPEGWLPPDLVKRADAAILAAYDDTDGAVDGIIADQRNIRNFDLDILRKVGFTPAQIATFRRIHEPQTFKGAGIDGDGVLPGFPATQLSAWSTFLLGMRSPPWPNTSTTSVSEILMKGAPYIHVMADTFTRPRFGLDYVAIDDPAELTRVAMENGVNMPSDPKDFSKLDRSGARVIVYHGVNDQAMSYLENLKGYEAVKARFPGSANWLRAFTIPGLWHCSGGTGPTDAEDQLLEAMATWVEKGQAPETVVTNRFSQAKGLQRQFRLCAEPKRVMLKEPKLDPNNAENWECRPAPAT